MYDLLRHYKWQVLLNFGKCKCLHTHNTSFVQSTLVACSSANRIQTSFTCVSRCVLSLPSVSVVASDSIHTHPNTEIRRSTSIDYTTVPSRAVRSSGLSVAGPTQWNALPLAIRRANSVGSFKSFLKTHLFREAFRTLC